MRLKLIHAALIPAIGVIIAHPPAMGSRLASSIAFRLTVLPQCTHLKTPPWGACRPLLSRLPAIESENSHTLKSGCPAGLA